MRTINFKVIWALYNPSPIQVNSRVGLNLVRMPESRRSVSVLCLILMWAKTWVYLIPYDL